jgi:acetolactate synthase I/II/III large subunit
MYTPQALWTQAREKLDVTTVVFANRSYKILNVELGRVGVTTAGPKAARLLDLRDPELDWVALAQAMGVEATRAVTIAQFIDQFRSAMSTPGPRLIEARI